MSPSVPVPIGPPHRSPLARAVGQLPRAEYAAEAAQLAEELESACRKRGRRPCLIGALLPAVLARLGVNHVESTSSGEVDPR